MANYFSTDKYIEFVNETVLELKTQMSPLVSVKLQFELSFKLAQKNMAGTEEQ